MIWDAAIMLHKTPHEIECGMTYDELNEFQAYVMLREGISFG